MFIVTNIVLLALAGLIAYWWATQGFFSSLLHFICVVVAGALALAFWEPLTFALMNGSWFDDYAWGVSLVGLFVVILPVIRISCDKIVRSNVNIPHWANLTFGGILGAGSGVLTVGILVIGLGHIQSRTEILGFNGFQRDRDKKGSLQIVDQLWIPYHTVTGEFYSYLSVRAFSSGKPLQHYMPRVDRQATLVRDTFEGGKGHTIMRPSGVSIRMVESDGRRLFVTIDFTIDSLDYGEQLTLTSAQARLVEKMPRGSKRAPEVLYPVRWHQGEGPFQFDHVSHILSSDSGKDDLRGAILEFQASREGFVPAFILIKGTRFTLPALEETSRLTIAKMTGTGSIEVQSDVDITSAVLVSNKLRSMGVNVGKNEMPPGLDYNDDGYLTVGDAIISKNVPRANRALAIKGIFEPDGTRCVQVDISRKSSANLFGLVETMNLESSSRISLVDDSGETYTAVGFMLQEDNGTRIKIDQVGRIPTVSDLPSLATAGTQKLVLLFYVSEGETITGLTVGAVNLGWCNVAVR